MADELKEYDVEAPLANGQIAAPLGPDAFLDAVESLECLLGRFVIEGVLSEDFKGLSRFFETHRFLVHLVQSEVIAAVRQGESLSEQVIRDARSEALRLAHQWGEIHPMLAIVGALLSEGSARDVTDLVELCSVGRAWLIQQDRQVRSGAFRTRRDTRRMVKESGSFEKIRSDDADIPGILTQIVEYDGELPPRRRKDARILCRQQFDVYAGDYIQRRRLESLLRVAQRIEVVQARLMSTPRGIVCISSCEQPSGEDPAVIVSRYLPLSLQDILPEGAPVQRVLALFIDIAQALINFYQQYKIPPASLRGQNIRFNVGSLQPVLVNLLDIIDPDLCGACCPPEARVQAGAIPGEDWEVQALYSLGVLLWEHLGLEIGQPTDRVTGQCTGVFKRIGLLKLSAISRAQEFQDRLKRCVDEDPSERPASLQEFMALWREVLHWFPQITGSVDLPLELDMEPAGDIPILLDDETTE